MFILPEVFRDTILLIRDSIFRMEQVPDGVL